MNYQSTGPNNEVFDEEGFQASKRSQRRQAVIFMVLGGMILLDSGSPVPIPLTGLPSLLIGSAIMLYGWYNWRAYQRLPLHEALQLGRQQGGQLNRTDLFLKLRLTPEKTDALLEQLVSKGFIERINDNLPPENEVVYRLIS